jgi:hypothetical protein
MLPPRPVAFSHWTPLVDTTGFQLKVAGLHNGELPAQWPLGDHRIDAIRELDAFVLPRADEAGPPRLYAERDRGYRPTRFAGRRQNHSWFCGRFPATLDREVPY